MVRSPEPIVSKTMGRGSHSGRTLAAILPSVLMLLILLMTSMIPLITYAQDTSMDSDAGDDGETYTVTYVNNYDQSQLKGIQNGSTAQDSLTVTYHGQAIAEYNPQFWNTCITGDVDGGVKPRNWFTMPDYNEIENTKTMVFVGWTHHEGWQDIEGGFGIASDWYNTEGNVVDPGDIIRFDEGNSTTLYAMWANINNLFFADDYIWGDPNKLGYSPDIFTGEPISFDDGCKYTNIVVLTRNVILGHNSTTGYILSLSSDATVGFTIRSMSGDEYLSICGDLDDDWSNDHYVAFTKVDLIIDNIGLVGHGYEDRPAYGLFANGNQIIIGANVSVQKRLDIYAGSWEGYEESDRRTDLRIFSGNYSNIYGASYIEASESFNVVLAGEASVNNIYGGGYDAVVTVELPISIHVIRATVRDDIYLGGRDVDDSNSSDVGTEGREHGLSLIVSDAAVGGSIYIGGQDERGQDGRAHLYASTIHLEVYGSKIGDSIWGGGRNAGTSCDELRILIVGSTVGTDGGADSGVFGEGTRYATAGVVGIDIRSGSSIHGLIRGNGGPIGIHGCDQSSGLLSRECLHADPGGFIRHHTWVRAFPQRDRGPRPERRGDVGSQRRDLGCRFARELCPFGWAIRPGDPG